jgi:uncharacterized protein (DUF952 family)
MSDPSLIVHVLPDSRWDALADDGAYRHPSLDEQGFIHCSRPDQVVPLANSWDVSQDRDFRLVCIDPDRLEVDVVTEGEPTAYPHVYGPIPDDAIVDVLPFPVEDGNFQVPDPLEPYVRE